MSINIERPELDTSSAQRNALLEFQLAAYLDYVSGRFESPELVRNRSSFLKPVIAHNRMMALFEHPNFQELLRRDGDLALSSKVIFGFVGCIDGRIPYQLIAGPNAKLWRVPAGVIQVDSRASDTWHNPDDSIVIPQSTHLCIETESHIEKGYEIVQVGIAHKGTGGDEHESDASTGESNCAAAKIMSNAGIIHPGEDLLKGNRRLVYERTLEPLRHITNTHRLRRTRPALYDEMGVVADYNIDTLGMDIYHLAEGFEEQTVVASTANLLQKYRELLRTAGIFDGTSFSNGFANPNNYPAVFDFMLRVSDGIQTNPDLAPIREELTEAIAKVAPTMSGERMHPLLHCLYKNIGLLETTNYYDQNPKKTHPFTDHHEMGMALSIEGALVGKWGFYDQNSVDFGQIFGSNAADTETGISYLHTKLSILREHGGADKIIPLYVCANLKERDLFERNDAYKRARRDSFDIVRVIMKDKVMKPEVINGKVVVITTFMDEGKVVGFGDPSSVM